MTIKEVCEKYGITQDTLRYYERIGVIPEVSRTSGGIRNYSDTDIKWVESVSTNLQQVYIKMKLLVTWSYTKIGKVKDLDNWEKALGGESVTITFSL